MDAKGSGPVVARARAPLVDGFGRVARDLRISVTDRCNFRCRYCMPAEGLPWMPKSELLSFEEIARLTGIFVDLGIRSIKVTGGEPLVRRDVDRLIRMLRTLGPELDISMTTNGFLLGDAALRLADAGLDRVTVSCDSLLAHRFQEMTLRDALEQVMSGLRIAAEAGLTPVKINCVVIRGVNDDEVVGFAQMARDTGFDVRFIEYMPLDAQGEWDQGSVVPARDILQQIAAEFTLVAASTDGEPATTYRFADGAAGSVGVIPSVSEPFCDSCDRLRLTADGQMRACLFALDETDLRTPLRSGASGAAIGDAIRQCVASKWSGHRIGKPDFTRPSRSMSMIGG